VAWQRRRSNMDKANCGAPMKPQKKNTPKTAKMAMGGMMGKKSASGSKYSNQKGMPTSVQAKTATVETPIMRQQRKKMGM